jgi:serine phosphatase RsbU (regulator of sigma subunit)
VADRRTRHWRARLLGAVVLVALVLLAGFAADAYQSYRDMASNLVLDSNREAAFLYAIRFRDELKRFSDDLLDIARSKEMTLGLATRQRAALRNTSARLAIFDGGVVLLDGFGKVRATEPNRPEIIGTDWSDRELFRTLLTNSEPHFTSVAGLGPDGANVVVVSAPILGENRELIGVLAGMFRLGQSTTSSFYASIVRLRVKATGNTYLVDNNGRILFDSGFARIGQFVTLPWDPRNTPGDALVTTDPDGNEIVLAYAPIPGTDWALLVENDWAIASQPIRRYAGGLAALLALGMLLPAAGLVFLLRSQRGEAAELEQTAQESRLAALMRKRLLPKQAPLLVGYNVAVRSFEPGTGRTPGDFYDLMLLLDGRLVVTLGSVDEQGLLATHVMAMARAGFRAAARKGALPAQALAQCNTLLCPEVEADSTVSSIYALLDPSAGRLMFAAAGQPAPLRWYNSVLSEFGPSSRDLLLGRDLDTQYSQHEASLSPGETLVFYSRGFDQLQNKAGEPFEVGRMARALAEAEGEAENLAEALAAEVRVFLGDGPRPAMDLTFIVLVRERQPATDWQPQPREQSHLYLALAETETDL